MGCDIHLYAEVKKEDEWTSLSEWIEEEDEDSGGRFVRYLAEDRKSRFYTNGRNYNLFSALCGVRNWYFTKDSQMISKPKGFPLDADSRIHYCYIRWGRDAHSASWNTLKELKVFDWSDYGDTVKAFLDEVIPKMESASENPENVRIVYWFDN